MWDDDPSRPFESPDRPEFAEQVRHIRRASKLGNRFEALEPIRQGLRARFGGFDKETAVVLAMHRDHGSDYMNGDFQAEPAFHGMSGSPSFVREPEGNGCAEQYVRTLKENLLWVRAIATATEFIETLREFRRRYDVHWSIERQGLQAPSQALRTSPQPGGGWKPGRRVI